MFLIPLFLQGSKFGKKGKGLEKNKTSQILVEPLKSLKT